MHKCPVSMTFSPCQGAANRRPVTCLLNCHLLVLCYLLVWKVKVEIKLFWDRTRSFKRLLVRFLQIVAGKVWRGHSARRDFLELFQEFFLCIIVCLCPGECCCAEAPCGEALTAQPTSYLPKHHWSIWLLEPNTQRSNDHAQQAYCEKQLSCCCSRASSSVSYNIVIWCLWQVCLLWQRLSRLKQEQCSAARMCDDRCGKKEA